MSGHESIIFTNIRFVYVYLKENKKSNELYKGIYISSNYLLTSKLKSLISPEKKDQNKKILNSTELVSTAAHPNIKNLDNSILNEIFEIKSIDLSSIYYIFIENNDFSKYKYHQNISSLLEQQSDYSVLKIYYYDNNKINNNNKLYDRNYVDHKKINLNLASSYVYFRKMNNMFIKKMEIKIQNSKISNMNLDAIVKEFNEKIRSKYMFNFGIPKVAVYQNDNFSL